MTVRGAGSLGLIAGLGGPVALLVTGWFLGLRLNLTGSLPVGVYVASRSAPVRGALVLACLPAPVAAFAKARGYVPQGDACPGGVAAVGKRVLAVEGDTVTVGGTGLVVNGTLIPNSQALKADRRGLRLPELAAGRYIARPGTVWILSAYSRFSFDSRYFGAIGIGQVRANLRRLWTAEAD